MIRLALFAAAALFLIGVGWKTVAYFEANYITEAACTSRVTQALQTVSDELKDATDDKKNTADDVDKELDSRALANRDDLRRLCKLRSSCRDNKGG